MTTQYELISTSPPGELGILLPNHLASSLSGDTGLRARHLSEATGLPVVAYERPSTATRHPQLPLTIESYLTDVDKRAQQLRQYLGGTGVKRLVVTGNSAAGLDALAMSLSMAVEGTVNVQGVLSLEPAGMRGTEKGRATVSAKELWQYLKAEREPDKTDVDDLEYRKLPIVEEPERSLIGTTIMTKNIIKELFAYKTVYSSDIGRGFLSELATNYPEIPTRVVLGNRSKATTPTVRTAIGEEFAGTSVEIKFLPAAHSFPDRQEVFIYEFKNFMLSHQASISGQTTHYQRAE